MPIFRHPGITAWTSGERYVWFSSVAVCSSWSLCRWSAEKIDLIMKKTLTTAKVLKDLED